MTDGANAAEWVSAGIAAAGFAMGGASLIRTWKAPKQAQAAIDTAKATKLVAETANSIAVESRAVAEKANELAEVANRIAGQSKEVAEAANDLAGQANALAEHANQLAAESNGIASDALEVSRESAMSARESAAAALATADHERAGLALQRQQRHESLRPDLPARLQVKAAKDTSRQEHLTVEVQVDGDYRVAVEVVFENSTTRPKIPLLLMKGVKQPIPVESLAPDEHDPKARAIRFRFWPPTDTDDVDVWTCGCGETEQPDVGRGHWEREVPLYRRPPAVTAPIYDRLLGQGLRDGF